VGYADMLALAIAQRGAPAEVTDIAVPAAGPGEVLVAVEAASVNGFDLAVAAGYVWDVMPHTFPVVLGRDFAGTVESVGQGVDAFAVGDRVAGSIQSGGLGRGAIAERVTASATWLTRVPDGVTSLQAAAVGLAAVSALDAVAALDIGPDDVVLVSGATGGVGVFAVQLAADRGARVIATARPGEASDVVRRLGAAAAVDYRLDLVAAVKAVAPEGVRKTLHAAGDPAALAAVVVPGGLLVSLLGADASQVGRDDITVTAISVHPTAEKLAGLLDEVAAGRLEVPVAATFPLEKATDALAAFSGPKVGKIVVEVAPPR
jgi:NADPH:quinone reductase-like Zn-dependent oxidoreductase